MPPQYRPTLHHRTPEEAGAPVMLIGILGELLQACAVGVDPVEVGRLPSGSQPKSTQSPLGENSGPSPQFISQGVIWRASSAEQTRRWAGRTPLYGRPPGECVRRPASTRRARTLAQSLQTPTLPPPWLFDVGNMVGINPSSATTQIPLLRLKASIFPSGEKRDQSLPRPSPHGSNPAPGVHRLFWC